METVEYFMVAVAAYLIFMVYESVVDIASGYEFRQKASVLRKYGLKPFELRLLFTVYPYPVSFFKTFPYILGKEFEILVECVSKRSDAQLSGRTSQNKMVVFDRGNHQIGDYVKVRITGCSSATLFGEEI